MGGFELRWYKLGHNDVELKWNFIMDVIQTIGKQGMTNDHHLIPPHLIGPGDVTAALGIITAVFNLLPTILGILAGILGIAWYCVLFYDRFWRKVPADNKPEGGI